MRSDNWDEKLGKVSANELTLMTGNQRGLPLTPVTLADFLQHIGAEAAYAGLEWDADLSDASRDAEVSIRFQTTFLPVADEELATLEFA